MNTLNVPERISQTAIGRRIKAARTKRGLTADQAVKLTGIDRATYYALESGVRPVRLRHLQLLHSGLKTRPGEILSI
jgi:transcriptional regulator with XRE-family HTH domain